VQNVTVKRLDLEKGMYQEARLRGVSFPDLLEEMDPSEEYGGSLQKAGAFARQLLAHDIKVFGPHADVIGKFFASTASAVLFPHYVESQIHAGMLAESLLPEVVATETLIPSHTYDGAWLADTEPTRQLHEVGEGAELPTVELRTAEHSVKLRKFGRMLKATYESLRLQRANVVSVWLQRIGAQLAIDESDAALQTLLAGDGNGNALTAVGSEVSGTLDYDELVRLWLAFPAGYRCRKLVVGDALLRTLLNLDEFQNPAAGFQFQANGELVSPVGAKLLRWSSQAVLPSDFVLGIDERYALEHVTEFGVLTEVDRLIDRQIEATTVSKWAGFVKLDPNAAAALDVTHA
jgi:hypothetical protein